MGPHVSVVDVVLPPPPPGLTLVFANENNVVAHTDRVFLQMRVREQNLPDMQKMNDGLRLLRARTRGPLGGVAVVLASAITPPPEIRERQKAMLRDALDGRSYFVFALEGESMAIALQRTFLRAIFMSNARVHIAANVAGAATWVGPKVETEAREVMRAVEYMRACASTF